MMYRDIGEQNDSICFRDVTSPINELDVQSNSSRGQNHISPLSCLGKNSALFGGMVPTAFSSYDTTTDDSPFFDNDMPTMRSSSSSSEGLPHVTGLNWEGSVESNEVSTEIQTVSVNQQMRHSCCSNTASFSARTLINTKRAALGE